jgi:hypothetical protein
LFLYSDKPLLKDCLVSSEEKILLNTLLKKDIKELQKLCAVDDEDLQYLFFAQVLRLVLFHFYSEEHRFLDSKTKKGLIVFLFEH